MAEFIFKLPDIGEGTAEAEIVAWHVKPGDRVAEDQRLVDVMTDKAIVEMTSPVAGTVVTIHGHANEKAPVGAPLVVFDVATDPRTAETSSSDASKESTIGSTIPARQAKAPNPVDTPATVAVAEQAPQTKHRVFASPAVRRRAFEQGVPLQFLRGTGPSGRITQENLNAFIKTGGVAGLQRAAVAPERSPRSTQSLAEEAKDIQRAAVEEFKIVGLRRKIAERMQEAKWRIPHITYVEEMDLTELDSLREHLNATRRPDQPKLTLLPFLVRALVRALPEHPSLNARFDDDAGVLHRFRAVHCGIATQTPNGLLVPVVRHAESLGLWMCAAQISRLATAAREGKATREELSGSTITITSLGSLGGVSATHVINRPEVAIIGPNKLVERPVVRNGTIVVRRIMNLSSSFDHRIVDGYEAAAFVQRLKSLLERPATLFVDTP